MSQELSRNILEAAIKAAKEISRFHSKPDCGLEYLEPYLNINEIDGIKKQTSDTILSLYSATVADCYREKAEFISAAKWYRRASAFRITGFTNLYADMVIRHKLSDYYEHALMCLEQGRKEWKSKPLYQRIYNWLFCLYHNLKHPWDIPELVSLNIRSKTSERKLQQMLSQKTLTARGQVHIS
jgi:hypothetical protein